MKQKRIHSSQQGFTMIEVLLSMVLYSIISLTISILLWVGVKSAESTKYHGEVLAQARLGMQRMAHEILRLKTSNISGIASNQLSFTDSSAVSTDFRFATVSGNTRIWRGSDILIPQATALTFTYLDGSGNTTATIGSVRRIQWDLTIPQTNGGSVNLKSAAYLRGEYYASFR